LFKTWRLHGSVFDGEGAGDLGGASSIDNTVISDEVANDAEGVV
jgi:hypothetical protein